VEQISIRSDLERLESSPPFVLECSALRFRSIDHFIFRMQLLNDAVLVPMDTVKQKRQLNIKHYSGTFDCIRKVVATEGLGALYAGYMTTLVMNVPYNFFYFPAYEMFRGMLKIDASEHDVMAHVLAGGGFAIWLYNALHWQCISWLRVYNHVHSSCAM
jgi:hypothetical protein